MQPRIERFQAVALVVANPGEYRVEPTTSGADRWAQKIPVGRAANVVPRLPGAAFRLIIPDAQSPLDTLSMKLGNTGTDFAPLALRAFTRVDGTPVSLVEDKIIDLADVDNLAMPEVPLQAEHSPNLSIAGTLNTTILTKPRGSIEATAARAVLRMALSALRINSDQRVFGNRLTVVEHRNAVNALDLPVVMKELAAHPEGYKVVREYCEFYLSGRSTSDDGKKIRAGIQTVLRDAAQINPVLAPWFERFEPKKVASAEVVTPMLIKIVSRPTPSFVALSGQLRTATTSIDFERVVRAIREFSGVAAARAGSNPAERAAMNDVIDLLNTVKTAGAGAAVESGKAGLLAARTLADDSDLRRELQQRVAQAKKRADIEARKLGLDTEPGKKDDRGG